MKDQVETKKIESTSDQQFLLPSMKNIETKKIESTSDQQILLPPMKNQIETKKNESTSDQHFLLPPMKDQIETKKNESTLDQQFLLPSMKDQVESKKIESTSDQQFLIPSMKDQVESKKIESTSDQQFLLPSTKNIETKKIESTSDQQFLLASVNKQIESKKNESTIDSTILFDDTDDFDGFDHLQTISQIEANITKLENFSREQEMSSTVVDSREIPSTSSISQSIDDAKNDQQMKQVIEILEQQSDMIATELSNDCERNVLKSKTQLNLKSSTESIVQQPNVNAFTITSTDTDTKSSEIYETKYHHKQVYQNSIISQIDFSDLLKSTDSAETKQRTHSEFENLFKNLEDDQHSNKQESDSTDQNQLQTHSKCDQKILHSDDNESKYSPKHHFYRFSYKKTVEVKSSSSNKVLEVKSNEGKTNESKEIEETKITPSGSSTSMSTKRVTPTKLFSSLDDESSKNSREKLADNKPKTTLPKLTDNKQKTRPIISPKLEENKPQTTWPIISPNLEDSKTKTGWPSPLKGSKDLFENILSEIDQAEPSKLLTSEEIPSQPPKVFSSLLEYSKDEEDPTMLRAVSPSSLDISSKNDECDFFRNDPSEKNTTNKITTFTEALKSLSEEISRKSDYSSIDVSPRKVSKETEEIPEKPAQLQSDTKLSFANFFNKSPPKIKEAIISDNTETQKDVQVSISKNIESIIDKKSVTEPNTSTPIPKIVQIEKVTKPPLQLSNSVENKPQSDPTTKPTISATISKNVETSKPCSKTQSTQTTISQNKPIITLKTTGCNVQEASKFITALKVSVSQAATSGVDKQTQSKVTSESKPSASGPGPGPSGLNLTALGNSLRLIKEGDEYRLVSKPITASSSSVTSCNNFSSLITEVIRKGQEATAAQQNKQNQETQSKSIHPKPATKIDKKLKSILKTSVDVKQPPTKNTHTVLAKQILSTPTNVIKPGTSVHVNNRPMTVKSILFAPTNILPSKGTQGNKLGNITVLTTAPVTASITKPTGIPVKSVSLTDNTNLTLVKQTTVPVAASITKPSGISGKSIDNTNSTVVKQTTAPVAASITKPTGIPGKSVNNTTSTIVKQTTAPAAASITKPTGISGKSVNNTNSTIVKQTITTMTASITKPTGIPGKSVNNTNSTIVKLTTAPVAASITKTIGIPGKSVNNTNSTIVKQTTAAPMAASITKPTGIPGKSINNTNSTAVKQTTTPVAASITKTTGIPGKPVYHTYSTIVKQTTATVSSFITKPTGIPVKSLNNTNSMVVKQSTAPVTASITKTTGIPGKSVNNTNSTIPKQTTAPVAASITKPTGIPGKSVSLTDNTKSTIVKQTERKPLIRKSEVKPLTTFTNSLKIARESETIKQVPKSGKLINICKRSSDPIINITESDDNIEIAITNQQAPSKVNQQAAPITFANILKNQRIKTPPLLKKNNSPPSPMSIEYENHEGIKQTVFVQTTKHSGKIQSKSSDSQSSSSNESDFTVVRTSNGYLEVKPTAKSNLQMAKTFKIEYVHQNDNVPDLVPFSSNTKHTELGKRKLITENQAPSLGTKRSKNSNAGEGCSGTMDSPHNFQESTGGAQQIPRSSPSPSTNNVSVQQTTTVPSLSTIVTSPNIVQNSSNTTNGSTVSVVRSTSAIITNSTTLSSSNTDTPTLVNMLIHRPTIRTHSHQEMTGAGVTATASGATRLKQMYHQSTVAVNSAADESHSTAVSTVTVSSTPVSNIIRATATGVTSNHQVSVAGGPGPVGTIQVRGATAGTTSGTPHLLSFVNSSQLLKSISTSDGVKPLQLLYKISDGKTYITPVSLSASSSVKMATVNKQQTGEIVKVEVISPTSKLTSTHTHVGAIGSSSARSVFEETYAKFIHIGRTNQTQTVNNNSTSTPASSSSESITITSSAGTATATAQLSTLPKFQQAFGKTTNFSNSQTTRNTDQQPLLLVSKMGGASVVAVSSAPSLPLPVTSTITSTTSTPITVVPVSVSVSIGNTVGSTTSTIQRAISNSNQQQQQIRLIKTTNNIANNKIANIIENKNESNDVDSNASNDSLPPSSASQTVSLVASQSQNQSSGGQTTGHSHSQTVLTPMRLALPIVQRTGAGGIPTTRVMTPVLLRQRVLLTSGTVGTPIRLPQNARVLTSNMNALEPAVSSSTLEQLREFDKVFEKVKERSTTSTVQPATSVSSTATTVVTATVPSTTVSTVVSTSCFVSKLENSNTTADTSDDSTQTSNRSSTPIMATFQTAPHIDTSNLVVGSQQQRVSVAYVSGQLGQTILSSPVVVMQQQPMSMSMASSTPSPALSVTSQSSSSSPSSSSNANNNPNSISSSKSTPIKLNATVNSQTAVTAASKTIKNKPIKPNTQASPLKASPVPKPQQKPQEDEGTAQRIYSILAEYAEQLRNSPDLNNKPAPRRRSNPPANPSQNSKRKKSSGGKKVSTSGGGTGSGMEMSPGTIDDHRTIGSEDSSCGVQLHLSQLQDSPSQAMLSMDDAQSTEGSMDIPGMRGLHGMDNSNDCMDRPSSSQSASAVSATSVSATSVSVPTNVNVSVSSAHQTPQQTHRQLILTDTSNSTGNRNVIITDSVVSEALAQVGKITNTATVLVPGNYLLPMSMVKGGHQITIVSGGSKILAVKPLKLPTTLSNNPGAAGTSQQITTQVLVPTSNAQKLSTQILNRTMVSSSETSFIRTTQSATGAGILTLADTVTTRDHSSSNSLDFNSSGAVLTVQSSNHKSHSTSMLAETNNGNHRNTSHAHQLQLQVNDPTTISGSNGPLLSQLCNELNDNGNHSSGMILTDHGSASNVINVSPIHNGKVERDCISIDNTKNSFKKNWATNSHNHSIDGIEQQHHPAGASPIFRHSPGMQYATSTIGSDSQADKKSRTINNNHQKQLSIQAQRKQAAIERELRLQKSLSEECEDLGVDEPSASDLFPEAEILFDNTNQSPSFGVGANVLLQDVVTTTCSNDNDNDNDNDDDNINIFTNTLDNGSSRDMSLTMSMSMTTASSQDIKNKLNEHIDYLLVQKNKINKNGTTKFHANVVAQCSNSSQSSYEDTNTLITNTPLISDVTIPSPLPQSTSYCLPSPYRAESPLTQATHSHLYTYSKKSNTKLAAKKGRSYSLFESDCELSSSSHDDTNSRTSSTSNDAKDNDSLSDSASEAQSDNNTRKYSRKRPYKLYVYDENGVDASSFTCDKDETHETSTHTHLNNTPSSDIDNNEESMSAMSADMMEGMLEDSSESSPHSILSDSDLASISSGLRRASKRGHVRKGCPCCTTAQDTSSPPTKRKFGKKAFTQHGHAATKKIGDFLAISTKEERETLIFC